MGVTRARQGSARSGRDGYTVVTLKCFIRYGSLVGTYVCIICLRWKLGIWFRVLYILPRHSFGLLIENDDDILQRYTPRYDDSLALFWQDFTFLFLWLFLTYSFSAHAHATINQYLESM